jgi:hypothetical protein
MREGAARPHARTTSRPHDLTPAQPHARTASRPHASTTLRRTTLRCPDGSVARPPIALEPGSTYIDDFVLESLENAHAQPPVTMSMRTGTFRLVYEIQRTRRHGGHDGVDLLPLAARRSNAFRIDPLASAAQRRASF